MKLRVGDDFILFDKKDAALVRSRRWHIKSDGRGHKYAVSWVKDNKVDRLHRFREPLHREKTTTLPRGLPSFIACGAV